MNKYIKKCLIVYTSLALVLVGMAGVSYAITASDADQYITRSQYATDMTYLQSKLDEQESSLMGNINKYRSTDVKLVTWDTPTREISGTGALAGYHNGGNLFPRKRRGSTNSYPDIAGSSYTEMKNGINASLHLYRLWNGNYMLQPDLIYYDESSSYAVRPTFNFAVPCENLPGWYLECRCVYQSNYAAYLVSLVKLDPDVPYNKYTWDQIKGMELQFRFKKDFFQYCSDTTSAFPKTPVYVNTSYGHYANQYYNRPFAFVHRNSGESTETAETVRFGRWLDQDTGDYMMTIKGIKPNMPTWNARTLYLDCNSNVGLCYLIVKDNVEYQSGNFLGYVNARVYGVGIPDPSYIRGGHTDRTKGDEYWEYEFVDCVNGIKYWHAYRRPRKEAIPGTSSRLHTTAGHHYQIPILY